ncbi:hypothetical protein [Actinoplanes sp. NPDC020271]|uniref:hypothetical protein n=1 Tax=Actinoplanes sp. NPDC020271 TaxID=3363896 RepID=UPI00378D5722
MSRRVRVLTLALALAGVAVELFVLFGGDAVDRSWFPFGLALIVVAAGLTMMHRQRSRDAAGAHGHSGDAERR